MRRKRYIEKTTLISNIPILRTGRYTYGQEKNVVFDLVGSCDGIFPPFNGVFLLILDATGVTSGNLIDINNIYGEARRLYRGNNPVILGADNVYIDPYYAKTPYIGSGCYLCYFDTDNRRLYLVE